MRVTRDICFVCLSFILSVVGCDGHPLEPLFDAAAVGAPGLRAPSGADARPSNSTTMAMSWTDNSNNEAGFRIERAATSAGPWATAGTTGPNVTSFDDGGRTSEQQACYRVLALKKNGDASASNTDCSTPPAAASTLTATALDQQTVDVAWKDNSGVEDGYEVQRATAQAGPYVTVASLPANAGSYRNNGLTTNTTYWYRVRPNKDGGYGDHSNIASATPFLGPPRAPSGINTMPYYGVAIIVTWVDNATNEDGFRVERTVDGGATWIAFGPLGRDQTSLQDYSFQTAEQPVCYRVIAFNAQGDSPASNTDCTAQPAAPSNLVGAPAGEPAIELTWTDNSALEDGYVVERQGSGIIATLPANATSYRDAGVSPDVTYGYIVRATKDGGSSGNSNFVQVVVATAPPAAPSAAGAFPSSSSIATVTWLDHATNEAGFRVERSTDGGANWRSAGIAGVDYTAFDDEGQASEQPLCYRVFAVNNRGDSPPSNTACTTLPAAPSGLAATTAESGAIDLTWTDNSGVEDGYEVQRLITYCDWDGYCYTYYDVLVTLGPNATSYHDAGLNSGEYYSYIVFALKDGGRSDQSNEAATTAP